ncbi:hypothetical protein A9Q87_04330 [Flavobacteriales bacterium 34_180_T64]|nr:hypothetical protein A9Q87_04330 [Flavobacteriales bacterium 34_180_T64]
MRKNWCVLLLTIGFLSCAVEAKLIFKEFYLSKTENAIIEINYPKAEGSDPVAQTINTTIESHIAKQIDMSEDTLVNPSLEIVVKQFDDEFIAFKKDFPATAQKWEALIDSEVTYESNDLISIAINSYLDTGGAHGNSYIEFLNFDPTTGHVLKTSDLIRELEGFTALVETYFLKEEATKSEEEQIEDVFFGKGFQLPESIGFSDDGVIILYNTYEIASYAQGITEFTIPYEDANPYLKIRPTY